MAILVKIILPPRPPPRPPAILPVSLRSLLPASAKISPALSKLLAAGEKRSMEPLRKVSISSLKRKSDDELTSDKEKAQKIDKSSSNPSKSSSGTTKPPSPKKGYHAAVKAPSRTSSSLAAAPVTTQNLSTSKAAAPTFNTSSSTPVLPSSASGTAPATAAPKPGSLKDRLAKAAALAEAQRAKNPTGGIVHKSKEEKKPHLSAKAQRELAAKEAARAKARAKAVDKPKSAGDKVASGRITKSEGTPPPKSTYKGTVGLGRQTSSFSSGSRPSFNGRRPSQLGKRYVEEESESGSSDMEAGLSDLEEEEMMTERLGKLEDRREEELEKQLKSDKDRRRAAVAALAAKKAKEKKRY